MKCFYKYWHVCACVNSVDVERAYVFTIFYTIFSRWKKFMLFDILKTKWHGTCVIRFFILRLDFFIRYTWNWFNSVKFNTSRCLDNLLLVNNMIRCKLYIYDYATYDYAISHTIMLHRRRFCFATCIGWFVTARHSVES